MSDTTSSQLIILVPRPKEPPAADLLSELISTHIEFFVFCLEQMFNLMWQMASLGGHWYILPWLIRVLWRSQHLLRCLLEPRKIYSYFKLKPHQEGQRNTGNLPSTVVGRGTRGSMLANISTGDQINHLSVYCFLWARALYFSLFVGIQQELLSYLSVEFKANMPNK